MTIYVERKSMVRRISRMYPAAGSVKKELDSVLCTEYTVISNDVKDTFFKDPSFSFFIMLEKKLDEKTIFIRID